jgi:hypothetical protein
MKSESFFSHMCHDLQFCVWGKSHSLLNDCVINYQYLVLKHLWSCWQARSHHKMFSGRERKNKGVWKFVWNKMQMEMKFCVKQKEKESWKKTMLAICAWFKIIIIILILFHHKMELAIVFVFWNTLCGILVGKVEFSMYVLIVTHQSNFISKL